MPNSLCMAQEPVEQIASGAVVIGLGFVAVFVVVYRFGRIDIEVSLPGFLRMMITPAEYASQFAS